LKIRIPISWILIAGSVWLFAEFILFGKFSVNLAGDNTEIIVPGLMSSEFSGKLGQFWDNLSASGTDRKAFGFLGVIDVFLFTHLPGWLAYGVRMATMSLLSVFSVYALSRRAFHFDKIASVFVAFAYGVQVKAYLLLSVFSYLPMVLLALGYLLERKRDSKRWLFLAAAIFLISQTSYFSRLIPHASAVMVFWFLFIEPKKAVSDWSMIIAAGLAIPVLRTGDFLALMSQSPISHAGLIRSQLTLQESASQALNFLWVPGSPVLFACELLFLYALVARKGGDWRMKSVLAGFILGLVLLPLGTAVQLFLADALPFVRGYSTNYMIIFPMVFLTFAGGFGVQALADHINLGPQETGFGRLRSWGGYLGLILTAGVLLFASAKTKYASIYNWVTHGSYASNFESLVLKDLAAKVRAAEWPERVEPFQIFPAYLHAYGIETAGGYVPLYARRYYEFWGTAMEPWASNIGPDSTRYYSMFSTRAERIKNWLAFRGDRLMLFPDDYKRERRLQDYYGLNLLSLANVAYFVSRDRLSDDSLVPIREPKAPWSSLSLREKARINVRANFTGREHLYIYRNRDAFPRFFTVDRIKPFKTGKAVLDAMAKASVDELRRAVFVEKRMLPASLSAEKEYGDADIQLEQYTSDEIRLGIKSEQPAILIVGNSFSPYWKVEIDGKSSKIFPAYHAFWGLALPNGARSVVFRYAPPYR